MKTESERIVNIEFSPNCSSKSEMDNKSSLVKNREMVQDILHHNNVHTNDTLLRCTATRPTVPGVSEITDHLLLSAAAVLRPDILKRLGVKCVINATSELPDTPLPELGRNQTPVIYLRIPVYDRIESDLSSYFDLVADTIDQVRQNGGTTLVHCVAGISRSASLCLAYLMKYNGMSLRSAYRLVKSARPQIRPNAGFMRQLIAYEYRLHRTNSVQFVYNEVTKSHIPDLYEIDYEPMLHFQRKYKNVCLVGRH